MENTTAPTHPTNKRKKWGIFLIVWPMAALILSFLLYAVVNWVLGGIMPAEPANADQLFAEPNPIVTVMNVILFLIGGLSIFLGLPSLVVGIILVAMPATTTAAASQPTNTPTQPGKGLSIAAMILGICSIVFSWAFGFIAGVLAIIFGAIGLKRNVGKGMAVTGLVTGIVGVLVSIIIGIALVITAYAGISQRATNESIAEDATTVSRYAEAFNTENGYYPNYNAMEDILDETGEDIYMTEQGDNDSGDVIYVPCYGDGALIWYWNMTDEEYLTMEVGNTTACEL